ncbi:MAG: corrinoid protein [Planctomycetes bacterium]|nr:corrinoid protein [Planctomycetota bacterium]
MAILEDLTTSIKTGKRKDAHALVEQAINEKIEAGQILEALIVAMDDVGRRFKANEIFVPEVLIAARAMKTAMELLEPVLVAAGIKPEFKVVIGTVKGDLHDIGKNLVAMMLKGANFEVIDLGTDVTAEQFVAAAKEHNADLIGMSALLTTTMPSMKETVDAVKAAGISTKTMIGGAPVTQDFANEIGADGYSADAASAVDLACSLVA